MLIFVACYQFSFLFTLTPKLQICCLHGPIYPQCYSWGQLCTGSSRGDVFWEQPGSEWRIYPSRKPKHYRLQGGCSLATGSFWGLFTEDQPKQDMEAGGGFEDRGMKEEEKMRSNTGASLCLPSVLHSCCAQCLSNPTHHISGQKKMSFYLKLSFCESG